MNKNHKYNKIDPVIRSAMHSDPPPESFERLRGTMRERARQLQDSCSSEPSFFLFSANWWQSAPGNITFAFGSLLILLSVFMAHAAQPQKALAATIDAIRLAAETQQNIVKTQSMRCEFRRDHDTHTPPIYTVQWNASGQMTLEYFDSTKNEYERLMVQENGMTVHSIVGQLTHSESVDRSFMDDVRFIVNHYSNPGSVSKQIQGNWRLCEMEGNKSGLIYVQVMEPGEGRSFELWIDPVTKLPTHLYGEANGLNHGNSGFQDRHLVFFSWNNKAVNPSGNGSTEK